jgi:uncharacterized protein (TIRG00374 family)
VILLFLAPLATGISAVSGPPAERRRITRGRLAFRTLSTPVRVTSPKNMLRQREKSLRSPLMRARPLTLIFAGLKIAFAAALIFYLFTGGALDFAPISHLLQGRLDILAFTAVLLFVGLLLSGLRWWLIMRAAGFALSLPLVLQLQLIGAFFSTWLPGSAGGDAARGAYLVRVLAARRTSALLTLALDRLFSLFGLVFLAALLVLLNLKATEVQPIVQFYIWLTLTALALGAGGSILVYVAAARLKIGRFPHWLEKLRPYATQLRGAVILIGSAWKTMLVCAFVSVVASASVAAGIVVLSIGFSFAPKPSVAALAGVLGNISSAIPLTPGGIGIGEMAFAKVCEEIGNASGPLASIYLSFRLIMASVSFSGMFCWLFFNSGSRPLDHQTPGTVSTSL